MDKQRRHNLIVGIKGALELWEKQPPKLQGIRYESSKNRLEKWLIELENEENAENKS